MKNYEKYANEIKEYKGTNVCNDFIRPHILKIDDCGGFGCGKCSMLQMLWFVEEYKEPETDWSKVEVDTPILVRNGEDGMWGNRYFAKYENETIYAWDSGRTSWTANGYTTPWRYAKLAESENE